MANELDGKTLELIKRIKTSKGKLSFENIESLITDFKRLGEVVFLERARSVLAPVKATRTSTSKPTRASASKDEVLVRLEKAQRRAALISRDFVETTLEYAVERGVSLPKLAVKDRSLPKLLAHFRTHANEDDLFSVVQAVITKHSRTH